MADTILDTAATTGILSTPLFTQGEVGGTIDATPMAGSFNTLVDSDWYAINVTRGHTYSFEAIGEGSLTDVALAVVDANRDVLAHADSGAVNPVVFLNNYLAATTGTLYVAMSAGGSNPASLTGNYNLFGTDDGATQDSVLDTAATTGQLLGSNTPTFGNIDATPMSGSFDTSLDHDWYAVSLVAGDHYTFSAVGMSSTLTDVAIDLVDANRNILNSQGLIDGGLNGTATLTYTATTTGTFYVAVGAGGSDPADQLGEYSVTFVNNGGDTVLDTPATTASLTFDETQTADVAGTFDPTPIAGSFNTSIDHDWYAVSLIAGHRYLFQADAHVASNILAAVTVDLAVRDANRNIVDPQGVAEGTTPLVYYTPRISGTYYVDVSAGGGLPQGETGDYAIFANAFGTVSPDTVLDTPATTASLTMNGTVSGTIDAVPESGSFNNAVDHDWYAVSLTAGERYTFSTTGSGLSDVAISLMNSNRTVVDTQGVVDGGPGGSTITFTAPTSGTYYLDISAGGSNAATAIGGYQIRTTDNGPNHLVINLVPDASVTQEFGANYQSSTFWTEVQAAANFFETHFFDPITVTIDVGWGEIDGQTVPGGEAESEQNQTQFTFSQIVEALTKDAQSANDATAVAHLPTQDPGPGGSDFTISYAEARALGLSTFVPPQDGYIGFATDWAPTDPDYLGVVEHEISEVLGRGSGIDAGTGTFSGAYSVLDLFRYSGGTAEPSSATGPGGSTYFSIDGGATSLETFSSTAGEDPGGDWADGTNDAFAAVLPDGTAPVSATDLTEMDVLGYDTAPRPIPVTSGGIDYRVPVPNGGTTATPTSYIGAGAIAAAGYEFAVEYIGTASNAGYLRASNSLALAQQGLSIVSVYAKSGMSDGNADGTYSNAWVDYFNNNGALGQGTADAIDAISAARVAGETSGAIFFDINLDPANANSDITESAALAEIDEYFREINTYFTQVGAPYSIGVLGAGDTLSYLQADPSSGVRYTWLADTWSGQISAVSSKNLEQTDTTGSALVGGQSVNLDTAYGSDFGQWKPSPRAASDFNGDGKSDIFWRDPTNGTDIAWTMNGSTVSGTQTLYNVPAGFSVAGMGDFTGNGTTDILWRNPTTGADQVWLMGGGSITASAAINSLPNTWTVADTADFNGDGKDDILLRNSSTGANFIWTMNGDQISGGNEIYNVPSSWTIAGVGRFFGGTQTDFLLRQTSTGTNYIWEMSGTNIVGGSLLDNADSSWSVAGLGDFNGDGTTDILMRQASSGTNLIWSIQNGAVASSTVLPNAPSSWTVAAVADFNGDGTADILMRNATTGTNLLWTMQNGQVSQSTMLNNLASNWSVAEVGDFNGDGTPDVLWHDNTSGANLVWTMSNGTIASSAPVNTLPTSFAAVNNGHLTG